VQCDLVRPHCSQCLRCGKVCPGYRDVVDLRFRVENVLSYPPVLNRDNRRRRTPEELPLRTTTGEQQCHKVTARRKETHYNHERHAESSINQTFAPDLTPLSVFQRAETPTRPHLLGFPSETNFRALLMARLITDSGNSHATNDFHRSYEVYDVIRRVIQQAAACPLIQQICDAFGLAYTANESRFIEPGQNSVCAFQSALAAVAQALRDPQQRLLDSTLVAVWMIDVYEVSHDHVYLLKKYVSEQSS
jgi:hypothetical protein